MRKIWFRAKRSDNGEWVEGYYIGVSKNSTAWINTLRPTCTTKDLDNPHMIHAPMYPEEVDCNYSIDINTLGEYTGANDGNNQMIFEGDIIQFGVHKLIVYWNEENYQWAAKKIKGYDVIHYNPMFPREQHWNSIDLGWIDVEAITTGKITTVVIGNVFDNLDLIEDNTKQSESDFSWEF